MSSSTITWKKIVLDSETNPGNIIYGNNEGLCSTSNTSSTTPIGIQKQRRSSFKSLYSPMTRRGSFLSKSMLANESLQCYRLPNYRRFSSDGNDENLPSYSIALSESQGFLWNQDLFASSYQQSEAGVSSMLSMSDGSYYLNDSRSEAYHADTNHSIVDVIDVVVSEDEYNSDVDIETQVFKVRDEEEVPDTEEDDDEDEDEVEAEVELDNIVEREERIGIPHRTVANGHNGFDSSVCPRTPHNMQATLDDMLKRDDKDEDTSDGDIFQSDL